jgi:hypothetical protein
MPVHINGKELLAVKQSDTLSLSQNTVLKKHLFWLAPDFPCDPTALPTMELSSQ